MPTRAPTRSEPSPPQNPKSDGHPAWVRHFLNKLILNYLLGSLVAKCNFAIPQPRGSLHLRSHYLMKRCFLVPAVALMVSLSSFGQSKQKIFHLAIGDPQRRTRDARVVLDAITDSDKGDVFSVNQLAARLHDTRLLLIGEEHTTAGFHRVELRVIRALHDAGRKVTIGLEMFPYTEQKSLDNWGDGLLTETGFVTLARWYEFWGYSWDYYRDIFLYARDNRIPMYGVNTPRNVVTAVRQKGIDHLSDSERQHVPPQIDVDNADHLVFFQASFDDDDSMHGHMPASMLKSMQAAQATWDASMGYNSVKILKGASPPIRSWSCWWAAGTWPMAWASSTRPAVVRRQDHHPDSRRCRGFRGEAGRNRQSLLREFRLGYPV